MTPPASPSQKSKKPTQKRSSKTTLTPTGSHALEVRPGHERQLLIYGRDYSLTPHQERCLVALALNPQQPVSQETLILAVWAHDVVEPANLATIITQLRQLGVPVVTVTSRGYMLQMPSYEVSVAPV